MSFSEDEVERYARHLVLAGVGGPGQQKLKDAVVTVIGAGGLGSPVIAYLAAAGVGTIRIVDDDVVSLSNLQRQIIYGTADVGRPKVESAADAVARTTPHVAVVPVKARLDEENARALVEGSTVVADGSDNPATRYAVSDACHRARVPLVSAAVSGFHGHVTTLAPWQRTAEGQPFPTYRCLFPSPPPDALVDPCAMIGILGVVTGVIGTLQANEVLKLVLGVGEPLYGKILLFDSRDASFETFSYAWDPDNTLTGSGEKAPSSEK